MSKKKQNTGSSTFFPASEALPSASNEPDLFEQSSFASATSSVAKCSKNTGRTSQRMTTSEPSIQMDLLTSTSSSADFHANRIQSPGSNAARRMTVTSGRKWLGLLKSYGLGTQFAKTCAALLTRQWGSSVAYLTWNASDTKPHHLLFQLSPSMRLTSDTECLFWPTPAARDWKGANSEAHLAKARGHHDQLPNAVRMRGHKNGQLNPNWVEWVMGFPIGYTELPRSETPSSRKSSPKSQKQSSRQNNES